MQMSVDIFIATQYMYIHIKVYRNVIITIKNKKIYIYIGCAIEWLCLATSTYVTNMDVAKGSCSASTGTPLRGPKK